jgi:ribosomal subunit interface protein
MLPVQITIRNISSSSALDTNIRKRVNKLSRFCSRINSCRVVMEVPQKHKHQGKLYNVRIDLTVPGKELVVTHKCDEDAYVAIRDAFNALERQLEEHSRKRHGYVKTHCDVMHGHVTKIISEEGYGFIQGIDGSEYYFSIANVAYPKFDKLARGDAVEYIADTASDGRQARRVSKARSNHHHEVVS